jgi:hypothetical protein
MRPLLPSDTGAERLQEFSRLLARRGEERDAGRGFAAPEAVADPGLRQGKLRADAVPDFVPRAGVFDRDPRRGGCRCPSAARAAAAAADSMPLGLILGRPLTPFSRVISTRSAAFSAMSRALSSRTRTSHERSSSRPSPSTMTGCLAIRPERHERACVGIPAPHHFARLFAPAT